MNKPPPRLKVSLTAEANAPEITDTVTPESIIDDIRQGRWAEEVSKIRELVAERGKDDEEVRRLKKKLPGVVWTGTFSYRNNDSLLRYSGLICADLDYVPDRLNDLMDKARSDPHAAAAFTSPTGTGLKIVFRVPVNAEDHKVNWHCVRAHVAERYAGEIDEDTKDLSRLCFVSHDPDAFWNPTAVALKVEQFSREQVLRAQVAREREHREPFHISRMGGMGVTAPVHSLDGFSQTATRAAETAADESKINNKAAWLSCQNLSRLLNIPDLKTLTSIQKLDLAEQHYACLVRRGRTKKEKEHYMADIMKAINNWDPKKAGKKKNPIPLAWELTKTEPPPGWASDRGYSELTQKLDALCFQANRLTNGGDFSLAHSVFIKLVGLHPANDKRRVSAAFSMMINEGRLKVTREPDSKTRKATTYRYAGTD